MKVLVTGGSGGIGFAVAEHFGRLGHHVILADINSSQLDSRQRELTAAGYQASGILLNLMEQSSIEACAQAYQIDILINNAGITRDNLLMRMKDEEWFDIMQTNLTSVYRLSKAVMRTMMKKRFGRIISIGSVVGSMGNAGQTNYAAAKAGVLGFTKSLAKEVASRGITVNAIAPGFIDTDMTKDLSDEQKQAIFSQVPANRLGQPEEIAATVAFLASRQAAYITGETIHVNGGMYMV